MRFEAIDVIGATGAVGRELLALLAARGYDIERVRALASARSVGERLPYGAHAIPAEVLDLDGWLPSALVLLACDTDLSRDVAKVAANRAELVIDNSSAFRADPAIPLTIPELLDDRARTALREARLIASPNCSTIQLALILAPLQRQFGLRSVDVCTYQAVSGAGRAAVLELERQHGELGAGRQPTAEFFGDPIAGNVFPHESAEDETGWNGEERKIRSETRRLLGLPDLDLAASCVRVPVERAHAQAVHLTLAEPTTPAEVLATLAAAPGVQVPDCTPTPRRAESTDEVLVGRVRALRGDPGQATDRFGLWTTSDQLRKGAALNVLHIADLFG